MSINRRSFPAYSNATDAMNAFPARLAGFTVLETQNEAHGCGCREVKNQFFVDSKIR